MHHIPKYALGFLLLACGLVHLSLGQNVLVKDLKLYVECEEYIIKAMAYSPVPLGYLKMNADKTGGGGFCSVKRTPYGEWKSACFDSDFFDGSSDIPERFPAGPASWFRALWDRDFPVMKELGVNTLRLYNTNPVTRQASIEQLGTNSIIEPLGKDHIPFMDLAQTYDFKVIFPLCGDYTLISTLTTEAFQQLLRNQIDEVGNHSALIMWDLSNELNLAGDPGLVTKLNGYIAYIKQYTKSKWNRDIPITTAVVDVPTSYNTLMATLNVDVFSSNAGYRGLDFQDLWSGDRTPGFAGFANLSAQYQKPLFVSEIGWHQINNSVNLAIPDWFNQVWKDLVNHIDQGCIGGCFFEYSDELNKEDPLQQTMGVVSVEVAVGPDGRSDDPNVFLADNITPKPNLFASIKNGTFEGVSYNFNSDVLTLLGRTKSVLPPTECVPLPATSSTTGPAASTTATSSHSGVSTSTSATSATQATGTSSNPPPDADMSSAVSVKAAFSLAMLIVLMSAMFF